MQQKINFVLVRSETRPDFVCSVFTDRRRAFSDVRRPRFTRRWSARGARETIAQTQLCDRRRGYVVQKKFFTTVVRVHKNTCVGTSCKSAACRPNNCIFFWKPVSSSRPYIFLYASHCDLRRVAESVRFVLLFAVRAALRTFRFVARSPA